MKKIIYPFMLSAILAVPASLASNKAEINYGNVSSVQVTTPDSKIAQSAIMGGVIGLALTHDISGTLGGATAGFAISSAMEGDRRVYLYTLDLDNKPVKILIETGGISEGQCVAIETQGKHTNLRVVSSSFCQIPQHKALNSNEVIAQQKSQAKACDKARRVVLTAKTDNEIDHALVKVRALCE